MVPNTHRQLSESRHLPDLNLQLGFSAFGGVIGALWTHRLIYTTLGTLSGDRNATVRTPVRCYRTAEVVNTPAYGGVELQNIRDILRHHLQAEKESATGPKDHFTECFLYYQFDHRRYPH